MKKKFIKVMLLTLMIMLSSFILGAKANTVVEKAQIYGKYDVNSSEPITVIVELQEKSIVESKHAGKYQTKQNLKLARNVVLDQIEDKASYAKLYREYDYVFSGFSIELPEKEVLSLASIPGIKAVYPNMMYKVPEVQETRYEVIEPLMFETGPYIGSNEVWDLGYTGVGITVAVIDTGTDYTHPDLAHAFGEYKGYDFVDDDYDPQEGPGQYHGTHVSGTIAGNGLIKGIAPDAKLLVYRVLGADGGSSIDIIAAIEQAVLDGANVMNLSLGIPLFNYPDYPTSIALDWAMAEGVVAVTSNGNEGPDNWTVGSPGTSRQAISVGATDIPYNLYNANIYTSESVSYPSAQVLGFGKEIGYDKDETILQLNNNTYEFVDCGLGFEEDFVDVDVEGKIALISRGVIAFWDKVLYAKENGAIGAIIYNNGEGDIPYYLKGLPLPTIKLNYEGGQKMLQELENGNNTVTFGIEYVFTVGETIADFSSRGPVNKTWMIKPDVSAPGVDIISTAPGGTYQSLQGTSMASPHVAGAVALILQAHPNWGVDDVKAALMNTAERLVDPFTGEYYAHNTQGAGSIRIAKAINTDTLVVPGSYSFGVFDKNSGKQVEGQSFEIKNLTDKNVDYTFEVEFFGNPEGIKVITSNNTNINPNQSQQVNFNVQVDASKLAPGYYEGLITVSDGEKEIKVPSILFVGEPDYPRVTYAGVDIYEDYFVFWSYLFNGADVYAIEIYDATWAYKGVAVFETDLIDGYHEFIWDGTMNGSPLQPGIYNVVIYVEKADDYTYALLDTIEITN